ncbi:MAG: hypothetical protein DSY55_06080 [Clostridia bacterium]|nr:MAG: hypothetical protein DSY55_06080 [Clostridia bacterium]
MSRSYYFWPVPRKDFTVPAGKTDPSVRQSLLDFCTQHPPQCLETDGQKWEYVASGDGLQTILFLQGMTGAYDIWRQQMIALSKHYRVISVTYQAEILYEVEHFPYLNEPDNYTALLGKFLQ